VANIKNLFLPIILLLFTGLSLNAHAGPQPPVADAGGPYTGTAGTPVSFDGSASSDPDGTVDSYAWDFGDGGTGTGVAPTHTYASADTYTVTLTVTDNDGETSDPATTTATIAAAPQAPTADAGGPYSGTVGVALSFDGSASNDPDGTIVSYSWDFGDGSALGTGVAPTHIYGSASTYTVTLTVTDNDGTASAPATTTATIADAPVGNLPPTANAGGPYTGTAGVPLSFDGSASNDPDGSIVSYAWDFGDGNTGTGATTSHTYAAAGTFTVSLMVTDDGGLTDTATSTATIADAPVGNQPPTADAGGPYTGTAGVAVSFNGGGSSDPDGSIASYAWDFGDGNTGTGATPSHTYAAAGTFTVSLMVTDDGGLTDTATTTATIADAPVGNQPPTADAGGPYTGTAGVAVSFNGTASTDPDGSIASYAWDFGDGNTGTGATPSHTYAAAGIFTVSLTVTDNGGATSAPATTSATIASAPPGGQEDCNGDGISDDDSRELGLDPCDPDGDTDKDELSDVEETGGDPGNPLPVDSDDDGIIDALEPGDTAFDASIASGLAVSSGVTASVTTAAGETLSQVSAADAINVPSSLGFPFGIISYTTTSPVGGSVTVRTTFDADLPDDPVVYKVDKQGIYRELPTSVWKKVNSRAVDITLRDGDPRTDLDGEINGSIDDPVGVGLVTGSGGSGGCTLSTTARFDPVWLFLLVAPGVGYLRRRVTALKGGASS